MEECESPKPQSWNRYTYVLADPVNAVDPTGKCQQPTGLSPGQIGICVATFISTSTVPNSPTLFTGLGDDRGPMSDGGTYREEFEIIFDPATGSISVTPEAGTSRVSVGGLLLVSSPGSFSAFGISSYVDPSGDAQVEKGVHPN